MKEEMLDQTKPSILAKLRVHETYKYIQQEGCRFIRNLWKIES